MLALQGHKSIKKKQLKRVLIKKKETNILQKNPLNLKQECVLKKKHVRVCSVCHFWAVEETGSFNKMASSFIFMEL